MTPAGKTVLVLGYGEMGHAMQVLLDGQHDLHFWDKFPAAGMRNAVVAEVAPQADFVIFCLPARPHREVAEMILPMLKAKCICIGIAKGLNDDGQTAVQVFSDVFGSAGIDYAFLYGPMISEELRAGKHGFADAVLSETADFSTLHSLFLGTRLVCQQA